MPVAGEKGYAMSKWLKRSLMAKAQVPITVMMAIMAVVVVSGVSSYNRKVARDTLTEHAAFAAQMLSGASVELVWNMDHGGAETLFAALAEDRDFVGGLLLMSDNAVFASEGKPELEGDSIITAERPIVRIDGKKKAVLGKAVVKLSTERAEKNNITMMVTSVGVGLVVTIVIVGLLWLILKSVTKPIVRMAAAMVDLAGGNTDVEVPAITREDELGRMAQAVQTFRENAVEKSRLEADQARTKREAEEERKRVLHTVAATFETDLRDMLEILNATAHGMTGSVNTVAETADRNARLSLEAAATAERVSGNVQTVSAAVEQLATSIREISTQAQSSHRVADDASQRAQQTVTMVTGLVDTASRIGDVVTLITSIASQTNLLALNATIEAARAGEAGKGFAVVANEVKNLANQTAKATEEISAQINAIQSSTDVAAHEINEISKVIGDISSISASIAAAVEQQNAATGNIGHAVGQAAGGTSELLKNVHGVAGAAQSNGEAAGTLLGAIGTLEERFSKLRHQVDRFIGDLRAA